MKQNLNHNSLKTQFKKGILICIPLAALIISLLISYILYIYQINQTTHKFLKEFNEQNPSLSQAAWKYDEDKITNIITTLKKDFPISFFKIVVDDKIFFIDGSEHRENVLIEKVEDIYFDSKTIATIYYQLSSLKIKDDFFRNLFFLIFSLLLFSSVSYLILKNLYKKIILEKASIFLDRLINEKYHNETLNTGMQTYDNFLESLCSKLNLSTYKQQQLEKVQSDLERAIDKKTFLYKEEQFKAIAASKAKTSFLTNMSHELRTPLNSIILLSDLLVKNRLNNLTPEQLKQSSIINKSGKDLLDLVNSLLDIGKIEQLNPQIYISEVDIKSLTTEVFNFFESMANEKGIKLQLNFNNHLSSIFIDEKKAKQVLTNIVNNAIKFTKHGTVTINICDSDIKSFDLLFEIIDTGIGIEENKLNVLFESFYQVHLDKNIVSQGSGLGLYISNLFIKQMNGIIKVKSQIDKGSTFKVYLKSLN